MPLGIEFIRIEVNVDGGDEIRNVKFSHSYNATRMLPFPPWSPRQCLMKNYISIGKCEQPKNKKLARKILNSIGLCAKKENRSYFNFKIYVLRVCPDAYLLTLELLASLSRDWQNITQMLCFKA